MSGFISADGADYLMSLFSGTELPLNNYYLALVTEPVGATESGVELSEPQFEDYYRAELFTGPEFWTVAYGVTTNAVEISLPIPGDLGWTGIVGWALCDAQTEGRVLFAGALDQFDIPSGEQAYLPPGTMTLGVAMDGWREDL